MSLNHHACQQAAVEIVKTAVGNGVVKMYGPIGENPAQNAVFDAQYLTTLIQELTKGIEAS